MMMRMTMDVEDFGVVCDEQRDEYNNEYIKDVLKIYEKDSNMDLFFSALIMTINFMLALLDIFTGVNILFVTFHMIIFIFFLVYFLREVPYNREIKAVIKRNFPE